MASYHDKEFVAFCETGKAQTNGKLVMRGDSVYSYNVKIASVTRQQLAIQFHTASYSRTTSMHQGAVLRGFEFVLKHKGWLLGKSEAPL